MDKYIIIKTENDKYFFNNIKDKYNIYDMYKLLLEDYKLFNIFPKVNARVLGNWKNKINDVDKVIIFDTMYYKEVGEYIKKKNPKCKTIMYFWNIIDDKRKTILKDKNIDEFYTFDIDESKKYNIKYNPQFYTYDIKLDNNIIDNDVFFLGRDKGRKDNILKLERELNEKNIKTNFIFLDNEYDYYSYDKYTGYLSRSKAILDFNIDNQVGLSLRCMEALFYEKKLITNNKSIKKYDFYNSHNVFILGIDDINKIDKFINSKYVKIDKKILDNYTIDSWLSRFN